MSSKVSFPQFLIIGHRKLKVVVDAKMSDHGKFDSDAGTIHVNPTSIDPKSSLLHEAVHAVLDVSGISQLLKDDDLEEAICVAMEMLTPSLDFKIKKKT